ncbi:VWA-like domain-containing protein [Streptomyces sp. NPDC006274]|uniref:vWA domain-containing protein n=1 Tax=unclassified Streptomyces TaxID=2593676 RepID=UPI0033AF594C
MTPPRPRPARRLSAVPGLDSIAAIVLGTARAQLVRSEPDKGALAWWGGRLHRSQGYQGDSLQRLFQFVRGFRRLDDRRRTAEEHLVAALLDDIDANYGTLRRLNKKPRPLLLLDNAHTDVGRTVLDLLDAGHGARGKDPTRPVVLATLLSHFRLGPATRSMIWLDCGSGADGLERDWELGPDGADGLSAQERDAVRFRVAQGINGRPGGAPRGWRRWAEEAFQPPQPWRELLGAAVRSAASGAGAGEDYTYGRPARRSAGVPGVVLPSLRRRPPRVVVIIDTSGSVSDAELGSALQEVAAISRAVGGRRDLVSVLSCDAAAGTVHPLCRAEGIPLVGGGGTNLRAGFAKALRARPRPDVIVVLTDGHTPWPDNRPPCRTVVGLFPRQQAASWDEDDPGHVPDSPPAWARVVVIGSSAAGSGGR